MRPRRDKGKNAHKPEITAHLFHFTRREELMMDYAIRIAEEYMKSYGKGRDPYMIDRKNYF